MAARIMFVQLKSGHDMDRGPAWIGWVDFSRSWRTASFRGRTLRRTAGLGDANFVDADSGEAFWVSGPKRDRSDARYGGHQPVVEPDAREAYEAFLDGAALRGRERG